MTEQHDELSTPEQREAQPMPEKQAERPREPSQVEVAALIADRLGETEAQAREQVRRVVWDLGRTQALALLEETFQVEASGGLLVPDGSRRRTAGGVFFYLARTKGVKKERAWLKAGRSRPPGPPQTKQTSDTAPKVASEPPAPPSFQWEDREAVVQEIAAEKGAATVKITLIGRPGKVVDKGTCVVTVMESTKAPALPKGLPVPSEVKTKYVVYIAGKQWKKVAQVVLDPEDVLILEGFPQLDMQTGSVAVFVSNATTKKLQQAKRQAEAPRA